MRREEFEPIFEKTGGDKLVKYQILDKKRLAEINASCSYDKNAM